MILLLPLLSLFLNTEVLLLTSVISFFLFINLFIYLFIYLLIYLFIYLFIYTNITM